MNPEKVAIVTGASSGIGRVSSILLAQSGYALALLGRRQAPLEETAQQIAQSGGGRTLVLPTDVSRPQAASRAIEQAAGHFGRLDALANIAGYACQSTIEGISIDQWRLIIDTNLSSIAFLTAAAWPIFRRQNAGIVVNVSSMASIDPFPGFAMYASAKAAVNMFTLCTAREGQPIGVRAVAVAPGAVETPMLRSVFDERTVPRDKTLTPQQVATVIRDCITGARQFVSGETIQVPSP